MKKLTQTELKEIKIGLPDIKRQLSGDGESYKIICVSVFDKWLTEEECEIIYTKDKTVIADWRLRLETAVTELYNLTNIFLWRNKRHDRISFYKPNSLKHLQKVCDISNQTWQSGHRYDILLPEFSAYYGEEWDWTNIVWYKDKEKIKPVLEALERAGLHILPNNN
ncbi:MAG: hypothetical protein RLZZ175_1199 [Bacteroidota bacterium]|jgi:hypothetical protein